VVASSAVVGAVPWVRWTVVVASSAVVGAVPWVRWTVVVASSAVVGADPLVRWTAAVASSAVLAVRWDFRTFLSLVPPRRPQQESEALSEYTLD